MATYGHGGLVWYPHAACHLTWKPGQTGNPGGRTAKQRRSEHRVADVIRKLGGEDCELYVQRLHDIAMDVTGEPRDSIKAIECLLMRTIGKPTETIVSVEENAMTDEEYAAEVAAIAREHFAALSTEERQRLIDMGTESIQ